MQKWTFRSAFWWLLVWLLRAGLLFLAFAVWGALQQSRWLLAGETTAILLLVFLLQCVARRQALGWIIDGNGERQKVERWNRGNAIFTPTTRDQRIIKEAQCRDERRKKLLWMGALGGGLAAFAWYAWPHIRTSDVLAMLFGLACLFGSFALIGWFANLLTELLYLARWQDMEGAQVLDAAPSRPGLDEVMRQKAHGDGRIASEDEALALLNQRA